MSSGATAREGWARVRFGDVVRLVRDRVDPETSGLTRYIAGEHMDTDDLRIRRWGEIGDGYLGPAFHMRFKPGQVLYGSRRTYLRKVSLADFEGICANTTFVLESADASVLLPELLPHVLQTKAFHDHSIKQSKGSVNPYVNFSDLAWYEFDLPPMDTQLTLARFCRRFIAYQDSAAILANASQAVWISRLNRAAYVLCEHHDVVPLTDLLDGSPESGHSPHAVDADTGTYVLGLSCLGPHGFIPVDYKSVDETPATVATRLNDGDLLISRSNTRERVGFCGVFRSDGRTVSFPDTMMRLVPKAGVATAEYLDHILRAPAIRTRLQSMAAGTSASLKKINRSHLADLRVPRPPADVQAEFVEAMQQSVALGATVEARRATTKTTYTMFLQQALG